jgi:hypothetical protein
MLITIPAFADVTERCRDSRTMLHLSSQDRNPERCEPIDGYMAVLRGGTDAPGLLPTKGAFPGAACRSVGGCPSPHASSAAASAEVRAAILQ